MKKIIMVLLFGSVAMPIVGKGVDAPVSVVTDKDTAQPRNIPADLRTRVLRLVSNPFFLAAVACVMYGGPREIIKQNLVISVVGGGLMIGYLLDDPAFRDLNLYELGKNFFTQNVRSKALPKDFEQVTSVYDNNADNDEVKEDVTE